jgi:hypothetical protein
MNSGPTMQPAINGETAIKQEKARQLAGIEIAFLAGSPPDG